MNKEGQFFVGISGNPKVFRDFLRAMLIQVFLQVLRHSLKVVLLQGFSHIFKDLKGCQTPWIADFLNSLVFIFSRMSICFYFFNGNFSI